MRLIWKCHKDMRLHSQLQTFLRSVRGPAGRLAGLMLVCMSDALVPEAYQVLLRSLTTRLAHDSEGATALFDPVVVAEADALCAYLETDDSDLTVWQALRDFYWKRYTAGGDAEDRVAAMYMFVSCLLLSDATPVPPQLFDEVIDAAVTDGQEWLSEIGDATTLDDFDRIIGAWRSIEATLRHDHPYRSGAACSLTVALRARFAHSGVLADLDHAVEAALRAVTAAEPAADNWCDAVCELVKPLWQRFELCQVRSDLDAVIDFYLQGVAVAPSDAADFHVLLSSLGAAYSERWSAYGEASDLDAAVATLRRARQATPVADPHLPAVLSNLSRAYGDRYDFGADEDDLLEALSLARLAESREAPGGPFYLACIDTLARMLEARFLRHGEPADLARSIELHRTAIELTEPGTPDRARAEGNLGNDLQVLAEHGGSDSDLDEAIELSRRRLTGGDPIGHELGAALSNLSVALHVRFAWTEI
jgi:hypothetical protein